MATFVGNLLRWDEPLGLTTVTAIVTGSFIHEAPSLNVRKFFILLGWYHTLMFVLFMIFAFINIFVATDFFSECLESMHFLVTGLHLFFKYMTMRYREKDFLDFFRHIGKVWKGYQLENEDFLAKTLLSVNKTTVIIFIVIGNVLVVNVITAIFKNYLDPEMVHFPIQVWLPPFIKENMVAGFVVQCMVFGPPLMIICMTTSFLNSISIHVEALGDALAEEIRRQKTWDSQKAKVFYRKHQDIVGIVLRINELMAWNWGFEMVCSSVQLTLPAYRTLRALKRNEIEVFNHAFILFLNFMVIYLIFVSGDRILSMGERIRDAFWETDWYESPLKDRKSILFMIFRSGHPVEYKYKFIHFDLPGFAKVVNTVFSYMALLRFLDGGESEEAPGGS